MAERGAREADVRHALTRATRAVATNGRWRVESTDIDGDTLVTIVVLEDGVVVVTLY
jgi:hypothetical protein